MAAVEIERDLVKTAVLDEPRLLPGRAHFGVARVEFDAHHHQCDRPAEVGDQFAPETDGGKKRDQQPHPAGDQHVTHQRRLEERFDELVEQKADNAGGKESEAELFEQVRAGGELA